MFRINPAPLNFIRNIKKYLFNQHNRIQSSAVMVLNMLSATVNVFAPILIAEYVRHESDDGTEVPYREISMVAGALLLSQMIPKFRDMLVNPVRAKVQRQLTSDMVAKCFEIEYSKHIGTPTGVFAQAINKNYSTVDKGIPALMGGLVPISFEVLASGVALSILYGELGAIVLTTYGVYLFAAAAGEQKTVQIRNQLSLVSYQSYGVLLESIGNYSIAHLHGNVQYERDRADGCLQNSEVLYRNMHQRDDSNSLVRTGINSLGFLGALIYAATQVTNGELDTIDLILISYFAMRTNAQLELLSPSISAYYTASVDSEAIFDFLKQDSLAKDALEARPFSCEEPLKIEFRNVCYHPGKTQSEKAILNGVSFTVKPREKVVIVGPTGGGKSTILKLLLRLCPMPTSGEILINDQNILRFTAASIRKIMALCEQSADLFNDTIEKNIRYADFDAHKNEIGFVAKKAKLVEDDELDSDYPSVLTRLAGERGCVLSGGEQQRVSIARALLKGGNAFLFDEPTSSLDPKTEQNIQHMLDDILRKNTTMLIVTHRLNLAINADRILYLEDGVIVEQGNFSELMAAKGYFYKQFVAQCQELGVDPKAVATVVTESGEDKQNSHYRSDNTVNFWRRRAKRDGTGSTHSTDRYYQSEMDINFDLVSNNDVRQVGSKK